MCQRNVKHWEREKIEGFQLADSSGLTGLKSTFWQHSVVKVVCPHTVFVVGKEAWLTHTFWGAGEGVVLKKSKRREH